MNIKQCTIWFGLFLIMISSTLCYAQKATSFIQNVRNPPPNPPRIKKAHLQIGLRLGYSFQYLPGFDPIMPTSSQWPQNPGEPNFGLNLNYSFHNAGINVGFFSQLSPSFSNHGQRGSINSWVAYFEAEGVITITNKTNLFAKTGVAFNYLRAHSTGINHKTEYFSWINAAGLEYLVNSHWKLDLQYQVNPGYEESIDATHSFHSPDMHMINVIAFYTFL